MKRPQVTLSYAQSIDGSLTPRAGEPYPLSGAQALQMTHELRAEHDAILIGIGTMLADDPMLNVRLIDGRDPQPIILDSRLRCPLDAKVLRRRPWIATTTADDARRHALEKRGAMVQLLPAGDDRRRVELGALLTWLCEQGIRSVLVEGGAEVITSFLQQQLADRLVVTIAPLLIGGYGVVRRPLPPLRLHDVQVRRLGDDVIVAGTL